MYSKTRNLGLAVPTVGVNAVFMAKGIIDELITVCEESIALSILRFLEMEKSVVEGAGAVSRKNFSSYYLEV
jgi:threonine dehydratase